MSQEELEKIKEQIDYYRQEVDTINKLYEKERLDHEETMKSLYSMMGQVKNSMDTEVATIMSIQATLNEKGGDLVKYASAKSRASVQIGGFMNNLEQELKKRQQKPQSAPQQQQQQQQQK